MGARITDTTGSRSCPRIKRSGQSQPFEICVAARLHSTCAARSEQPPPIKVIVAASRLYSTSPARFCADITSAKLRCDCQHHDQYYSRNIGWSYNTTVLPPFKKTRRSM